MARSQKNPSGFQPGTKVCYPAHGVGDLICIEETEIGGMGLTLYVIHFPRENMTLRIPTHKAAKVGLVTLTAMISEAQVQRALKIIGQDRKVSRAMWSRRAAEYEQKVNTSDLLAIAEVIRDINRDEEDPTENSYSENAILSKAASRLVDLLATFRQQDDTEVQQFLNAHLKQHGKTALRFEHW